MKYFEYEDKNTFAQTDEEKINFTCPNSIDEQASKMNHDQVLEEQTHISKAIKLRGGGIPQADVSDELGIADDEKHIVYCTYEENNLHGPIPQFDGSDGSYSYDESKLEKTIFSINCEIDEIVHLINFLRSSNVMWILQTSHKLCSLDAACFFCCTRSSCLRLRKTRPKSGPKSLKINEYICQLDQYTSILQWNWRHNKTDLSKFIENTLILISRCEVSIASKYFIQNKQCQKCEGNEEKIIFQIKIDETSIPIDMKDLIQLAFKQRGICTECQEVDKMEDKYIVIQLSQPVNIYLCDQEINNETSIKYQPSGEGGAR